MALEESRIRDNFLNLCLLNRRKYYIYRIKYSQSQQRRFLYRIRRDFFHRIIIKFMKDLIKTKGNKFPHLK